MRSLRLSGSPGRLTDPSLDAGCTLQIRNPSLRVRDCKAPPRDAPRITRSEPFLLLYGLVFNWDMNYNHCHYRTYLNPQLVAFFSTYKHFLLNSAPASTLLVLISCSFPPRPCFCGKPVSDNFDLSLSSSLSKFPLLSYAFGSFSHSASCVNGVKPIAPPFLLLSVASQISLFIIVCHLVGLPRQVSGLSRTFVATAPSLNILSPILIYLYYRAI